MDGSACANGTDEKASPWTSAFSVGVHFLIEGVICESRTVDVSIFEGFSRGKESNLWITFCGKQRSRIEVCVDRMYVVFMLDF
jgi:hypothetical protein